MEVYAESRRGLLGALALGVPLTLLGVLGGVLFLMDPSPGNLIKGVITLAGTAFFGWLVVRAFRLLRRQDPLFWVDDQRIECARGRFAWRDIRHAVEVIVDDGNHRTLLFILREETTPEPAERPYFDGDAALTPARVHLTPNGLEVGITSCAKQTRAALASYGHTVVNAKGENIATHAGGFLTRLQWYALGVLVVVAGMFAAIFTNQGGIAAGIFFLALLPSAFLCFREWIREEKRKIEGEGPGLTSPRARIFHAATRCAQTGEPMFQVPAPPFDEALWTGDFTKWKQEHPDLADQVTLRFTTGPGIPCVALFEPREDLRDADGTEREKVSTDPEASLPTSAAAPDARDTPEVKEATYPQRLPFPPPQQPAAPTPHDDGQRT